MLGWRCKSISSGKRRSLCWYNSRIPYRNQILTGPSDGKHLAPGLVCCGLGQFSFGDEIYVSKVPYHNSIRYKCIPVIICETRLKDVTFNWARKPFHVKARWQSFQWDSQNCISSKEPKTTCIYSRKDALRSVEMRRARLIRLFTGRLWYRCPVYPPYIR